MKRAREEAPRRGNSTGQVQVVPKDMAVKEARNC